MAPTSQSRSTTTRNMNLSIRTRDSLAQNDIITPVAAEGKIAPSIEEYRKAGEAIREGWTEEQRRRIVENEAMLRQMAESESKVGSLSHQTHLPRGNDLTVQEQIAVIHGGATPAQCADTREMLLERQRQDIVDNTSPITPVSPAYSSVPETKDGDQTQSEEKGSLEWDDFPELDARYGTPPAARGSATLDPAMAGPPRYSTQASCISRVGTGVTSDTTLEGPSKLRNINFLNTNPPCTGPCPIQHPHNQGAYLRQGQVPRLWNARWGYSDPPRAIWEAWVRIEQGRGSSWDEVEVDGFALSHSWAGP